jgi:hypothetical protein
MSCGKYTTGNSIGCVKDYWNTVLIIKLKTRDELLPCKGKPKRIL